MRKALLSVHISDIHFGALESKELMYELEEEFFDKLKRLPRIDFITINGDIFHYDLSLNSAHAYYAFKFFKELFKISKQKNCNKIRIIRGTKSHDHDQLYNIPFDESLDIKIISMVTDEEIFKDFRILYLPEEYIKNKDEYYKEYMNKPNFYNMICGHGSVDKVEFQKYSSETNMDKAPVFNSKKLCGICKGPIFLGHIHNASHYYNKIFYTGSFSRWCHGEEDPKGFLISIYDLQSDKFRVVPVINTLARRYVTRTFDKFLLTMETKDIINLINRIVEEKNIYKFRIIINEKNNSEYMNKVITLQNHFSNNKSIEFNLNSDLIKEKNEEEKICKYNYLLDDIPKEIKISKFLHDEMDYDMSSDRVNELLNIDILSLDILK